MIWQTLGKRVAPSEDIFAAAPDAATGATASPPKRGKVPGSGRKPGSRNRPVETGAAFMRPLALKARRTVDKLLKSADPDIQLQAAKLALAYGFGKPHETKSVDASVAHSGQIDHNVIAKMTPLDVAHRLQNVLSRARENADAAAPRQLVSGPVLDAEYVEAVPAAVAAAQQVGAGAETEFPASPCGGISNSPSIAASSADTFKNFSDPPRAAVQEHTDTAGGANSPKRPSNRPAPNWTEATIIDASSSDDPARDPYAGTREDTLIETYCRRRLVLRRSCGGELLILLRVGQDLPVGIFYSVADARAAALAEANKVAS